jgi:hypothetical protein
VPTPTWPEMTDAERRVAEADAYLQRLEEKQEDI